MRKTVGYLLLIVVPWSLIKRLFEFPENIQPDVQRLRCREALYYNLVSRGKELGSSQRHQLPSRRVDDIVELANLSAQSTSKRLHRLAFAHH